MFIDISKCTLLTTEGILKFFEIVDAKIEGLVASHLKCVTDEVMRNILRFKNLNVLDLSYNTSLSQEFFTSLADSPTKLALKVLKLDGIKNMTSLLLAKIFRESKDSLEYLSLENVKFTVWDNEHFKHLSNCRNLQYISMTGMDGVTEDIFSLCSNNRKPINVSNSQSRIQQVYRLEPQ